MQILSFSFDIGHSSLGWAVLDISSQKPEVLGNGVVTFPADDCLAISRRGYRRSRRNIRSARKRIACMKKLFGHLGVLSSQELNAHKGIREAASPHVLAARALQAEGASLSWQELWFVLRWYAHNRGYDGNARWSRQEDDELDSKRKKEAIKLMEKHGTKTMAETVCRELNIHCLDTMSERISSHHSYKTLNVAFPRKVVEDEVLAILEKHKGHLKQLDDHVINTLIARDATRGKQAWNTIHVPSINLPKRYYGGLLFGQLLPRFDNRMIARCPLSGKKVPKKASKAFLRYRWAMILANIKVDGEFLTSPQRQALNALIEESGMLTLGELGEAVLTISGAEKSNVAHYFELHPDAGEALVLDPALALFSGKGTGSNQIASYWRYLPDMAKRRALGRWRKGRIVSLQWMLEQCEREPTHQAALRAQIEKDFTKDQRKKNPVYASYAHFISLSFSPKPLNGRAPYSREIMEKVNDFVLSSNQHPAAEGGPIYRSEAILQKAREIPLAQQTNNHLVRQRIQILKRLTKDLISHYAHNDASRVRDIIVEVARDIKDFSGMTAKKIERKLKNRLSHFKKAEDYIKKNAPDMTITASLIRKCRIAMDLGWTCPFTGKGYDIYQLNAYQKEHIIPFADRPSHSLDSLVLTTPAINRLKGKRTAMQFINDMSGSGDFQTPKAYRDFVKNLMKNLKLDKKKPYPDDCRRQKRRQQLMLLESFNQKEDGFTQGALSQTSHLNRLAARQLEKLFTDAETKKCSVRIVSIPGQVTAEIRKAWHLLSCLAQASPHVLDENGKIKTKTDIRSITHLHHALDATVLGLAHYYLPGMVKGQQENEKGRIWQCMIKRKQSPEEVTFLMKTGAFKRIEKEGTNKMGEKYLYFHAVLVDLPQEIKEQISRRLAEMRIVVHIPSDQSGAHLEENPWRVRYINASNQKVVLTQKGGSKLSFQKKKEYIESAPPGTFSSRDIRLIYQGVLKIKDEKKNKLVGLCKGKLANNKSVLIIKDNYGIAMTSEPQMIPFHNVPKRIAKLRSQAEGFIPIIRRGMIVRLEGKGDKDGLWRVRSIKDNTREGNALDLVRLDVVGFPTKRKEVISKNVAISSLLKKKQLKLLSTNYLGEIEKIF